MNKILGFVNMIYSSVMIGIGTTMFTEPQPIINADMLGKYLIVSGVIAAISSFVFFCKGVE